MGVCNRMTSIAVGHFTPPIGTATRTNGVDNGHPAPTKQPPRTTPRPGPPTASQTGAQQQIQPTVTNTSTDGSATHATTTVSGNQTHANGQQTSATSSGSGSGDGTRASYSLTQLPNPSSSLGVTLQKNGTSKGRIIAAILGSILGVIIVVVAVLLICRRRRHSTSKLEGIIATRREQEIEPSRSDPIYQRNQGLYRFHHTHQPDDEDIDVERHFSRTSNSSSSFSLMTSANTVMEEKLNFRLNHSL
jgi:hypothetical protein